MRRFGKKSYKRTSPMIFLANLFSVEATFHGTDRTGVSLYRDPEVLPSKVIKFQPPGLVFDGA